MVGALGTLGVLGELTLRLHPLPDAERSWLVLLASAEAAQAFVERVMASTLQPNRIEFFNDRALRSVRVEAAAAGVALSFGSAAEAVREQGERLGAMAKADGARIVPLPEGFWSRAAGASTPGGAGAPWGRVEAGPFALMRAVKDEFDAKRVLNPGRFVGGL